MMANNAYLQRVEALSARDSFLERMIVGSPNHCSYQRPNPAHQIVRLWPLRVLSRLDIDQNALMGTRAAHSTLGFPALNTMNQ